MKQNFENSEPLTLEECIKKFDEFFERSFTKKYFDPVIHRIQYITNVNYHPEEFSEILYLAGKNCEEEILESQQLWADNYWLSQTVIFEVGPFRNYKFTNKYTLYQDLTKWFNDLRDKNIKVYNLMMHFI